MLRQVNAAPMNYNLGVRDDSIRPLLAESENLPFHLPKFFVMAAKGKSSKAVLMDGTRLKLMLDSMSLDKLSPYFNHATIGLQTAIGQGNLCMVQRIVPEDANPPANFRIWIDILATEVPNYLRNSDGGIVTDPNTGEPKVDQTTPTVTGYYVRLYKESAPGMEIGTAKSQTGHMSKDGTNSTMYPIMDVGAQYQGAAYNHTGIALATYQRDELSSKYREVGKFLPYKLSIVKRPNANTTGKVFASLFGEQEVKLSFKRGAIDPTTESDISIHEMFPTQWHNETDATKPLVNSDIGDTHIYYDSIETVLGKFVEAELPFYDVLKTWEDGEEASSADWYDFSSRDKAVVLEDELHSFNFLSLKTTDNTKFTAVQFDESAITLPDGLKEITIGTNTPFYMDGGSDGTLSEDEYEKGVSAALDEYIDINSKVINTAVNVESVFYDTGFRLPVKKKMANVISIRKDTAVILSTREFSDKTKKSLSEERAIASTLYTQLKLSPESTHWGTPVMRGMIVIGQGNLTSDYIKDKVPMTIELLDKFSAYMGGFYWKRANRFDSGENAVVKKLKNIHEDDYFIPEGIKATLWDTGIVYVEENDTRRFYFPALQTVYENDTSILNNAITMFGIIACNKTLDVAHRRHSGNMSLTRAQFADSVVNTINEELKDRLDGLFVIKPRVEFTAADDAKGYAYHAIIDFYGNNSRTVMTSYVVAKRMEDLEA